MSDNPSSFRTTARQIADAEDIHDRRRHADMLAAEIEVALNASNNRTQAVLWEVQEQAYAMQEKTYQRIDTLTAAQERATARFEGFHEYQSDTNLLLSGVAESLSLIQGTVQQVLAMSKDALATAQEALSVSKAGAARLGKLERNLRAQDTRHGAQIKALSADIAAIKDVMAARPQQRVEERERYDARLVRLEARLSKLDGGGDAATG